jgi:hypothetical protein
VGRFLVIFDKLFLMNMDFIHFYVKVPKKGEKIVEVIVGLWKGT